MSRGIWRESDEFCGIFTPSGILGTIAATAGGTDGNLAGYKSVSKCYMGNGAFPLRGKKRKGGRPLDAEEERYQVTLLMWHLQILGSTHPLV